MTDMNAISGTNPFCGPAVIATIAGITTDEAEKLILDIRNSKYSKKVTGTSGAELQEAFNRLGYKTSFMPSVRGYSLYMLLLSKIVFPGYYLCFVSGHVVAIEVAPDGMRNICDNHTKKPLTVSSSARLSQKVLAVLKVNKR